MSVGVAVINAVTNIIAFHIYVFASIIDCDAVGMNAAVSPFLLKTGL